jgi:chromosome segregation ATPase
MKKDLTPAPKSDASAAALAKTAKGSHRSMWELLLQLRALLPYLANLVPLLERLLDRANKPQALDEISQSITAIQTGSRDLEVKSRNQALQLERIEQQLATLRSAVENDAQQSRNLAAKMEAFHRRLTILISSILFLLFGLVAMVGYLLLRAG